ncbi:response regulator [Alkaliphilus transvaalensis]|uniref:response regulator n=1 Tax=Alkaliphilus transvaalensis TaxID=114628 RepID=UPI00047CD43A|nr:response regulator [Alkaliphilus transvaalensis]
MIRVLIVEDDPMVAQLNKRFVESIEGFKVLGVASNGEDALMFLKNNLVDLIILDVYMPKIDGLSVLKEMRKKFIKADVILVTAAKETENIDEALKLGAVDYLIKPFEFERLKSSLENYLLRYKLLQSKNTIQQEDIDRITKSSKIQNDAPLQKGLHRATLERIRGFMKKNDKESLTSEEIAEKVGMSRVTVRRYLEYLTTTEEIKLEVEYGSIGRPSHLYKYNRR